VWQTEEVGGEAFCVKTGKKSRNQTSGTLKGKSATTNIDDGGRRGHRLPHLGRKHGNSSGQVTPVATFSGKIRLKFGNTCVKEKGED